MRERQGMKQYQVADAAGITKGMLSSYETGRQRPSVETLEKVLGTLRCDLHDLHNALQIVNGRPQVMRQRVGDIAAAAVPGGPRTDVYRILGLADPMPPEEEQAMTQVLDGFHRLIRHLHERTRKSLAPSPPSPPLPASDPDDADEPDDAL
jgi:transcriptional regulator with XRE-family HTH domain